MNLEQELRQFDVRLNCSNTVISCSSSTCAVCDTPVKDFLSFDDNCDEVFRFYLTAENVVYAYHQLRGSICRSCYEVIDLILRNNKRSSNVGCQICSLPFSGAGDEFGFRVETKTSIYQSCRLCRACSERVMKWIGVPQWEMERFLLFPQHYEYEWEEAAYYDWNGMRHAVRGSGYNPQYTPSQIIQDPKEAEKDTLTKKLEDLMFESLSGKTFQFAT